MFHFALPVWKDLVGKRRAARLQAESPEIVSRLDRLQELRDVPIKRGTGRRYFLEWLQALEKSSYISHEEGERYSKAAYPDE